MTPERFQVAATDGVELVVHDYGGTGPTVVLAHATGFHGRYWDPVAELLTASWRVVSFDFRGHGDSTLPADAPLDWAHLAQDLSRVAEWLRAKGAGPLFAVGHSMGGATIVESSLEDPDRFRAAWLFEPVIFPDAVSPSENPLAERARRRRDVFPSREAAYDRFATSSLFALATPAGLHAYVDYGFVDQPDGTVRLKCAPRVEAAVFDGYHAGIFDRLGDVVLPTVVARSGDGGAPASVAPLVAEYIENARLEVFDELTHMAPLEDPAALATAITQFFVSH